MNIVWVIPIELLLLPIGAVAVILWFCWGLAKTAWEEIKKDWKD